MVLIRRGMATMASLKRAGKVVCIGRNYACVDPFTPFAPLFVLGVDPGSYPPGVLCEVLS